jgi:hypothetical protein
MPTRRIVRAALDWNPMEAAQATQTACVGLTELCQSGLQLIHFLPFVSGTCTARNGHCSDKVVERDEGKGNESVFC